MRWRNFRILRISGAVTAVALGIKLVVHAAGHETLPLSSLHGGVISGVFFVLGFLLSATIADYKESERIPSKFAATVENLHADAMAIHASYPQFDLETFQARIRSIVVAFARDVRVGQHRSRTEIHRLNETFVSMERAGVPPNFIVKLKQQQSTLVELMFRVVYIQRIRFIPSARILIRAMVPMMVALLVFTESESLAGVLTLTSMIIFIIVYMVMLLEVISTPFLAEGITQDDVSLFLIDETLEHLDEQVRYAVAPPPAGGPTGSSV